MHAPKREHRDGNDPGGHGYEGRRGPSRRGRGPDGAGPGRGAVGPIRPGRRRRAERGRPGPLTRSRPATSTACGPASTTCRSARGWSAARWRIVSARWPRRNAPTRSSSATEARTGPGGGCGTRCRPSSCVTRRAASSSSTRDAPSSGRTGQSSRGLAEEREHRHHAAMHVGFLREAELVEHRVDVLLDRALGEEQRRRDGRVVLALRHVRQDLPLTVGQLREGRVRHPVLRGHERLDDLRVQHAPPRETSPSARTSSSTSATRSFSRYPRPVAPSFRSS